MASYLIYNGVLLDVMHTNAYIQQPILSENGSDQIGVKVVIDVDTLYSPQATSYLASTVGPMTVAIPQKGLIAPMTDNAVSAALMTKRAKLYYIIGNQVVVKSPADGSNVDITDGPTPIFCVAKQISEKTWRVNFRIETSIRDCYPVGIGLLSNRWRQTHSIGSDHLTTVMTQGIAVFRTDQLQYLGVTADYFRSVLLPPHIYDFQRVSIVCRLNEIGNILTYEVVDRERFTSIGFTNSKVYGVIDFSASIQVGSKPAGHTGVASEVTIANFECVVRGDRNSKRAGLYAWASRLAIEKLRLAPPVPPGGKPNPIENPMILSVQCGEQIDAPIVSVHIVAQYIPPKEQIGALKTNTSLLGFDPGRYLDNPGVSESIFLEGVLQGTNPQMPLGTRGHFDGMMFAQELKTALGRCDAFGTPECMVRVPGYGPDDSYAGEDAVTPYTYLCNTKPFIDVSVGPLLFDIEKTKYKDPVSQDGRKKVVNEAKVDSTHEKRMLKFVAPVSGKSGESNPPLVFKLGETIDYRTAEWTAESVGAPPDIPHPSSNDKSEVLVAQTVYPVAPELAPDGVTPIYRVSGSYTYAQTRKLGPGKNSIAMSAVPWAAMTYEENQIGDPLWIHGFTDPTNVYVPPEGAVTDDEYPPSSSPGNTPA